MERVLLRHVETGCGDSVGWSPEMGTMGRGPRTEGILSPPFSWCPRGTDRLAGGPCDLGPRAWLWAQDRDLGLSGFSGVLPVRTAVSELPPRAHVGSAEKRSGSLAGDTGFGNVEMCRNESTSRVLSADID